MVGCADAIRWYSWSFFDGSRGVLSTPGRELQLLLSLWLCFSCLNSRAVVCQGLLFYHGSWSSIDGPVLETGGYSLPGKEIWGPQKVAKDMDGPHACGAQSSFSNSDHCRAASESFGILLL